MSDAHSLYSCALQIVEEDRHAGHSWRTVFACLQYAEKRDVNAATRRINELRERGIPRWLVQRWAEDARLTPQSSLTT
jgi:hypothetical protein